MNNGKEEDCFFRVTPYYGHHLKGGALMFIKGGWRRPQCFESVEKEVQTVRERAGLIDAHSMGKYDIIGKEARRFMQFVMTNDLDRAEIGKGALYSCLCRQDATLVDDIIVYALKEDHYYFITNTLSAPRVEAWLHEVKKKYRFDVFILNSTNKTAYLALQGPLSADILSQCIDPAFRQLKYFQFMHTEWRDVPILLARTGFTGELGYELNFPSEFGHEIWGKLLELGLKFGLKPIGGEAVQVLRSEKAYRAYGTDMDDRHTPFEAGLDWTVCLKKGDFMGYETLSAHQKQGVNRRIMGFFYEGPQNVSFQDKNLFYQQEHAGILTTVHYSPTLQKTIALGMIEKPFLEKTEFHLATREGRFFVTSLPFYDPSGLNVRTIVS